METNVTTRQDYEMTASRELNLVPAPHLIALEPPEISDTYPGTTIKKTDMVKEKERGELNKLASKVLAVGYEYRNLYKEGDYVYIDRFAGDGATRTSINNKIVVFIPGFNIVGRVLDVSVAKKSIEEHKEKFSVPETGGVGGIVTPLFNDSDIKIIN